MSTTWKQKTKIKICGLKRPQDIEYVNEAQPDYCGFIIEFPKSRRSVTKEQVKELTRKLDKSIVSVGVFVDAPVEMIEELLMENVIDMAQLHGRETQEDIRRIQKNTKKPVIKAFSINTPQDVENAIDSPADYILLDAGSGGTGKTFDWSLIPEITRPFFLAGGIGLSNLSEAISRIHPFAVDLSSSVETDGVKDRKKILETVKLVHEKDG